MNISKKISQRIISLLMVFVMLATIMASGAVLAKDIFWC